MLKRLLKGHNFNLLTYSDTFEQLSDDTNFGGLPVANVGEDFSWPSCDSCKGNMQFLGKINDGESVYLIFMCQNEPGDCEEWEAESGANKVIRFRPNSLRVIEAPEDGKTVRGTEYGCRQLVFKDLSYGDARANWSEKKNISPRQVLGQLGGTPDFLQGDEIPQCSRCGKEMAFVAQLETGPEYQTEMNFGGGCAYLFKCDVCDDQAKFLWQC